ncbi:MAG: anaerobic ribonucleoside-triphosphate reductase activating protein [Betaproteobacteria bacterium]|nr:anaerobic ribonucleoside-triphosphate reductase activating protein [Betaproteobacteria bacterium]
MRVGGLVPLSTTDYPNHLCAVVFCQGCPWRCAYCHNPHLLPRRGRAEIPWAEVLAFLERRRGLLDAVVFSGGEPTLQPALPDAMRAVKAMGFGIGLHTAGIHPARLAQVLPLVDWVGMDIKTEFHRYAALTGVPGSGERARCSMKLILASGVAHEFRTTVHPQLLPAETLQDLTNSLAEYGVRHYALQEFRREGCLDAGPASTASYLSSGFCASIAPRFTTFTVRRSERAL